jgi:hypothetical protein
MGQQQEKDEIDRIPIILTFHPSVGFFARCRCALHCSPVHVDVETQFARCNDNTEKKKKKKKKKNHVHKKKKIAVKSEKKKKNLKKTYPPALSTREPSGDGANSDAHHANWFWSTLHQ